MNYSGFTLIELLLASAIAALMGSLLFASFYQISRTVNIVDDRMDIESKIARLRYQLERDLSGACTLMIDEKGDPSSQKSTGSQQPAPKEPDKEKQEQKITKIFYSTRQGNNFDLLTFITNNPRPQFWGESEVKIQPLLARLVYKLQEDSRSRGSFVLMRQESSDLKFESFSSDKIRAYPFMDGIKTLSFKFTAKIEEEKKDTKNVAVAGKTSSAPEEKVVTTYAVLESWDMEKQDKDKEKEQTKKQKPIPVLVEVTGALVVGNKKRTVPFNFTLAIRTDTHMESKKQQAPVPTKQQSGSQPPTKTVSNAQRPSPLVGPIRTVSQANTKAQVVIPTQSASFFFNPPVPDNRRKG